MMEDDAGSILEKLNAPGAEVLDLLQTYRGERYEKLWRQDERLYRAFANELIGGKHPTKAFELAREGLIYHGNDLELKYLCALALARGGSISKATEYVNEVLNVSVLTPHLKSEALSLMGRLNKDKYERTKNLALKTRFAQEAAKWYEVAHQLSEDVFPGINAATMFLLAGEPEKARALAATAVNQAQAELRQPGRNEDYWLFATLGEAHLILGDLVEAARWYRKAVRHATGHIGDIASMRRNILLLTEKIAASKGILDLFNLGSVVAFSGHMLDHPRRAEQKLPPRFPPDPAVERAVSRAIQEELDSLNATVGYSSAACGADILFAERMLERDAELHVVLPFDREDFYCTSVDFGFDDMACWRERCDKVLERATEVHYATMEHFLDDDVLFGFVNIFTQGLAIIRAAQIGVTPYALVVLDRASQKLFGGSAYFLDRWTVGGREARVIDLAALRLQVIAQPPTGWHGSSYPQRTVRRGEIKRQVKAMLFADVKNFSKLSDEQAPSFFTTFLDEMARVIEESGNPPAFCNTWGDGLFLVFDGVTDCADFAMRLLNRIESMDFTRVGLPEDTTVRMGLHAGPVYPRMDRIIKRNNFFGSHVNRAARIEPVTTPGCAFTSEQFAALLTVEPGHDFVCEYIGVERLAKEFDRCPLYRLGRR